MAVVQPTPAAKRAKLNGHISDETALNGTVAASHLRKPRHLFTPYLATGIIANHVPFVLQVRHGGKDAERPDVNIVTSLGNSWSIWTAESLMQVFVGAQTPTPITQLALSTSPDSILASAGPTIHRFVRGKVVARYTVPASQHEPLPHVSQFIVFGDSIVALASTGTSASLHHFSLATNKLVASIDELPGSAAPTALLHPATYLNKVLLGHADGSLSLWNIRTGSLVHHFDAASLKASHALPPAPQAILALAQAPALDIVAFTTADNCVLIHDIKTDTAIATFQLEAPLSSAPPTFRTDGRAHTMAVASRSGDVFIFDLDPNSSSRAANTPRLIHTIRNAHAAPVSGLEFVPGQPLLVTSAADNAIKQWFFEPSSSSSSFNTASGSNPSGATSGSSSVPRLLKSREGHSEPPSLVRWYGQDGRAPLLSAARDRSVRLGWIGREARGGELSQGSIVRKANQLSLPPASLKLEPATSISFSLTRSRDWDDILTIHPSSPARLWYGRDRRMNASPLLPKQKKRDPANDAAATTGCVTHCGNFALVGTAAGTVGMWNMQSQRFVRAFDTRQVVEVIEEARRDGKKPTASSKKKRQVRGPGSKVVGVVADEGNKELAVVTASGGLYFFDFHTATLISSQQLHPFVGIRASPHATLLTLIPLGLSNPLYLLDFVTRRVVRKFHEIPARITDVTFSPTLRSLLVATMDGGLSTYDIPSGLLIDRMHLEEVIVSVDWSPDGSMIAGCGTEGKGIYTWSWTSGRGRVDEVQDGDDDDDDDDDDDGEGDPAGAIDDVDTQSALPSVRGPDADREAAEEAEEAAAAALAALDDLSVSKREDYGPSPQPLLSAPSHPLITLTSQGQNKWATLLNLDLIKARDRPKEAPQKPKAAPFFLGASTAAPTSAIGSVEGMTNGVAAFGTGDAGTTSSAEAQRETLLEQMTRSNLSSQSQSHIERLLSVAGAAGAATTPASTLSTSPIFAYLLSLPPPQLDLILRMELSTLDSIAQFLRVCAARLNEARDYEAVVAIVETLRRVRGEEMLQPGGGVGGGEEDDEDDEDSGRDAVRSAWREYLRAQSQAQTRVRDLLDFNIGTLSFLRGLPVV